MRIAVIPARGGSRRIPRKNIRTFAGKPMIAHAIEGAFRSKLFEEVIVTTDDEEIAMVAKSYGAATPFVRPPELADDHTPTVPVIAHAILKCQEMGMEVTAACCIYPCVPFISAEDLSGALALLESSGAAYSFPVTEFPSAIQRALKQDSASRMAPFYPEHELTRTQDLEPAYHDAGQFYWGWVTSWLEIDRVHNSGVGLKVPRWRVVDIDSPEDWNRAELIYKALYGAKG